MAKRIISGIIIGLLLLAVIMTDYRVIFLIVFLGSLVGLYEFYSSLNNIKHTPFSFVGYILTMTIYSALGALSIFHIDKIVILKFIPLIIILVLVSSAAIIIKNPDKYSFTGAAEAIFGTFYVSYLLSYIVLIRINNGNGHIFLIFMFIGIVSADSMALFSGTLFGKHKFMPKISPNKTLEGAVGSVIGTMLIMLLSGYCFNLALPGVLYIPYYHSLILGALISILAQMGDLMASSIKRYTGLKDFGNLIPGHGGILDRCDSIIFVAVFFYFYMTMFLL